MERKLFNPLERELEDKKKELGKRIEQGIKSAGLQKQTLAKILKKSPSEVSKWTSGKHNFTIETLMQLEMVLNIKLINYNR